MKNTQNTDSSYMRGKHMGLRDCPHCQLRTCHWSNGRCVYCKRINGVETPKVTKKMEAKYTKAQYEFICSLIWGGAPVDRVWAENTSIFQEQAPQLLLKYPKLNDSFNEALPPKPTKKPNLIQRILHYFKIKP